MMSLEAWLDTGLPGLLPGFLPKQRWFGGKAREIQTIDVEDAAPLTHSPHTCALVVVDVRYKDGARERYVLLVALPGSRAGLPAGGPSEPAPSTAATWALDAAADPVATLALLRGFVLPGEVAMLRGGRLLFGDGGTEARHGIAQAAETGRISALGAEQSNTSVQLDRMLVFKLFRRLDQGENPEVEIGRFLTQRTDFRAMAALRGSLTHVSRRGETSTVGVLQDWIANHGDGWTHVVTMLRSPEEADRDLLSQHLVALGTMTADLHAALAIDTEDPAFAPEPVTGGDVEAWRSQLLSRAARTFDLIERLLPRWDRYERRLGRAILESRDGISRLALAPQLAAADGFRRIRVHGDYHLGQVLRTPGGFAVIDFEGEPSRAIAERRLKQCALKDVAGMLRSFEYAVDASGRNPSATSRTARAGRLRESFLNGYVVRAGAHHATFLPRDPRAITRWVDFFEFEKALYEVDYEINNRPHWVRVPLQGMLRILRRQA